MCRGIGQPRTIAHAPASAPFPRPADRATRGFTLVELLVVVSIIAVLVAIFTPWLGRARELARRAACASNLHNMGGALSTYAAGNDSRFPQHDQFGGNWLWDLPNLTLDALVDCGGQRHMFYCPASNFQDADAHWFFTPDFRVTGYWWLNKRLRGNFPPLIDRAYVVHANQTHPDGLELVTDATISRDGLFYDVHGGSPIAHRASHMEGTGPAGGSIFFLDGHVRWRDFVGMEIRAASPWPEHWY